MKMEESTSPNSSKSSTRPPLAPGHTHPKADAEPSASHKEEFPVPVLMPSLRTEGQPKGQHRRKISWDPSAHLTQEDVAARMPVETESEAYILNSLENRDPTSSAPQSEKSIFSNITDDDLHALHVNDSASVASGAGGASRGSGNPKPSTPPRSAQPGHRRKETIGEKLQGLTAAMDAVHLKNLDFLDDDAQGLIPTSDIPQESKQPSSAAEAFGHNTNLLFKRKSEKVIAARTDSEPDTTPTVTNKMTADKRWKMLKNTIALTESGTAAANAAAVADIEVPEATDDKKDNASHVSGEDDKRKPSRKWKARKAEQIFRDLQDTTSHSSAYHLFKISIFFIMLPSAGIAFILFYLADNPPTGVVDLEHYRETGEYLNKNGEPINENTASSSWWLLFLGVRQVTLLLVAKFIEMFFIDFLAVRTKFSVNVFGPWATLFILQTKGWPFLIFTWGMLSLALLTGTKPFFHHWGHGQDYLDIFNEHNPSGEVVNSQRYHRVTAVAIAVGVIVSCKRFWLGLYLGRQTYAQFSARLESVMKRILLVSEVASLGRAFERYVYTRKEEERRNVSVTYYGVKQERLRGMIDAVPEEELVGEREASIDISDAKYVIDPEDRHSMTGQLSERQKARILYLLGQWAEPTLAERDHVTPTVGEILQFRRALEYLRTPYPFSGSFGLADRRETTIESAQYVYQRLLLRSPDHEMLSFDVIALLAVGQDGELDSEKVKNLIKVFKPDRDGTMKCVDFVKSVDEVYKELRLLRASVANSTKIDRAFESIFNSIFYVILICLILSRLGHDPLALFLSISGVILAFAFMIGSASSKYFEGLLFILLRRPYQIGDCIALSGVNEGVPSTGSPAWIVEDVDLFTTKLVFTFTGEKATVSNGALAASRVINASLSKEANLHALIKFPINVSFDRLQAFKEQLTRYFKNRPREWIAFTRFRPTRFEINEGFVEYIICGQHRLGWDKYGDLQQSKADLMHFSMELQKRMDLLFKQPTQPVDVTLRNAQESLPDVGGMPSSPLMAPASPGGGSMASEFSSLQGLFAPKTPT